MSLRVAAMRRFVSAADDDTRKGESITDAMATRSVKPKADGSDSIALAAIRHRRSFRGRACGARNHHQSINMVCLELCVLIVHSTEMVTLW